MQEYLISYSTHPLSTWDMSSRDIEHLVIHAYSRGSRQVFRYFCLTEREVAERRRIEGGRHFRLALPSLTKMN